MLDLHSPTFYLWVLVMITQLALCVIIHGGKSHKSYPAFTAYSYTAAFSGLGRAAAVFSGNYHLAFWTNSFFSAVDGVLMGFVAMEVYSSIYGPRISLPAWVPRHVITMIATGMATAVALGALLNPLNGGPLTRALAKAEIGLSFTLLAFFVVLLLYAKRIGITARPRIAGIARGFVLYLAVSLLMGLIRARLSINIAVLSGQVGLAAYLVSLVWWGFVLWGKETLPEKATPAQFQEMLESYTETKERLSALGIRTR